jgi:hypothetical protein
MTDLLPTTRLIRNPGMIAADMDGETVMMDMERGSYFGIAGIGGRIWEMLEQPRDIAGLVADISAEYDVAEADCAADVQRFVAQMIGHGLFTAA